jgi:histone acetyltransferase
MRSRRTHERTGKLATGALALGDVGNNDEKHDSDDDERMKALYPASNDLASLSDELILLKIARHSRCSVCTDGDSGCSGLRPPAYVLGELALDDKPGESSLNDLAGYGSDDEISSEYVAVCACGHAPRQHGMLDGLSKEERNRRALIAVRLDEHLQVRT